MHFGHLLQKQKKESERRRLLIQADKKNAEQGVRLRVSRAGSEHASMMGSGHTLSANGHRCIFKTGIPYTPSQHSAITPFILQAENPFDLTLQIENPFCPIH